ncbi:MAG: hypothetical protein GF364_00720 [Candidatus Lokiarchaeota archaeon]|nr:hypothetical protein [Candidatus Lokiarchaeota archaeon]
MRKRLKAGIIGTGWSANNIAKAINWLKNVELEGVCNHKITTAVKFGEIYDIPFVTDDYKHLIERKCIDFVIVSLPHALHCEVTLAALESDKHVLVEKPLATNLADGNKMVNLAKEKGLNLGIYYQNRFNESTIKAKEIIDAGILGILMQANISVFLKRDPPYYKDNSWRGTWKLEGGSALINQAVHEIDLLMYLLGDIERVTGFYGTRFQNIETEDTACAAFKFQNGVFGTLQCTTAVKTPFPPTINIFGTEGAIQIQKSLVKHIKADGKSQTFKNLDFNLRDIKTAAHKSIISDFVTSIIEHKAPAVPGKEGLKALEFILGIYKSKGKSVVKL